MGRLRSELGYCKFHSVLFVFKRGSELSRVGHAADRTCVCIAHGFLTGHMYMITGKAV